MATSNSDLIKEIKQYFAEEALKKNDPVAQFSNDVVNLAYQKISANLTDMIQAEEDPLVLADLLTNYMNITKMIEERDTTKQQILLRFFESLTKFEQNRYY